MKKKARQNCDVTVFPFGKMEEKVLFALKKEKKGIFEEKTYFLIFKKGHLPSITRKLLNKGKKKFK